MSRRHIHYWKCDRRAAFFGTASNQALSSELRARLEEELRLALACPELRLSQGPGLGNHLTFLAIGPLTEAFIRVEHGPEQDDHLAIESQLLDAVRGCGVRTPRVLACDASRSRLPLAWQALEWIKAPALSSLPAPPQPQRARWFTQIGEAIARWQTLKFPGFGIIEKGLTGGHPCLRDYFFLKLQEHLWQLQQGGLLCGSEPQQIQDLIRQHAALLDLGVGCLVHKDLALWNILGREEGIEAFIDFDDAIIGDPMDDFSLLGCFHEAASVQLALDAAQQLRPHPTDFRRRFWLHLLRNLIIKAVIRQGSGYFSGNAPAFLGGRDAAQELRRQTLRLLNLAASGLEGDLPITHLDRD